MDATAVRPLDVAPRFAAFAAAVGFFHHLPALVGPGAEEWVDLATPFAVLGAAALVLVALRPAASVVWLAGAAAILYVDGHGIHLAANAIRNAGATQDEAHFWDETWGHIEWHVGLFLLVGALCLADRPGARSRLLLAASTLVLGFTFFTNSVEGGDWWLALLAAAVFVPWSLVRRTPLRLSAAGAFALCAAGIGVWAAWHGGVPQFSELGWF